MALVQLARPLSENDRDPPRKANPVSEENRYRGVMNKADYVRSKMGGPAGQHHCHWPDCDKSVPPAQWGCKKHWFMLPKPLQRRIWDTFRPGQEESKTPSRAYVEAARDVQAWIAANHPPAPKQESLL